MTGNLQTLLDGVQAGDTLKSETAAYLRSQIQKRRFVHEHRSYKRFAVAAAVIFLTLLYPGILYITPAAYVDMDVNPAIALTVNRYYRVISAQAYNEDGARVLEGLPLAHKGYAEAFTRLVEAMNRYGYIQNDGLVSVTLQTDNAGIEAEWLTRIQTDTSGIMADGHHGVRLDVFSVSEDTRNHAHEYNISPAKYLAIQELLRVDPATTVEDCRDHSINEIRQQTQAHAGTAHNDEPCDEEDHGESHHDGHK